tara:strand:- start:10303 stop:10878 length:576 start_codon:yes stop_codon:yes gene_type:complete
MEVLIIIPARGGSKRLKGKNKIKLNGKPLFIYSFDAAKKLNCNPRIIVSTDDKDIQNICLENQIEYLERNPLLSLDYAAKQDVIVDVCRELWEKEFYKPDIVISLQANSPQLKTITLEKGLSVFEKSKSKNGWKEIICLNENGEQNGAIRIMTYRSVFQKTLSTYVTTYKSELIDIHTKEDLEIAEKLISQ